MIDETGHKVAHLRLKSTNDQTVAADDNDVMRGITYWDDQSERPWQRGSRPTECAKANRKPVGFYDLGSEF